MKKPPTKKEVLDYINGLKMELSEKYYVLDAGDRERLKNEIDSWEIIQQIQRQLM